LQHRKWRSQALSTNRWFDNWQGLRSGVCGGQASACGGWSLQVTAPRTPVLALGCLTPFLGFRFAFEAVDIFDFSLRTVKPKLPQIANLLRLKNDMRKLCHVVNDSLTLRQPLGLDLGHKLKPTHCRTPLRLLDCFDMTAGRALVRYQFQHCANARHAADGSRRFAQTGAIVRQVVKFRLISTHAGRIGRSIRPTIRGNSLRALSCPISP